LVFDEVIRGITDASQPAGWAKPMGTREQARAYVAVAIVAGLSSAAPQQ
jgi:hypothetical protein